MEDKLYEPFECEDCGVKLVQTKTLGGIYIQVELKLVSPFQRQLFGKTGVVLYHGRNHKSHICKSDGETENRKPAKSSRPKLTIQDDLEPRILPKHVGLQTNLG